jgi:hypothetical protein
MRWVTYASMSVDAIACAWVIRGELDPEAEFVFVNLRREGQPEDATPFAMDGADLGQHTSTEGTDTAFETILRRRELIDPTLWRIGEIVHEALLKDERYHAPEARGLATIVDGLRYVVDDATTLTITKPVFDGLYRHFYAESVFG